MSGNILAPVFLSLKRAIGLEAPTPRWADLPGAVESETGWDPEHRYRRASRMLRRRTKRRNAARSREFHIRHARRHG